MEYTVTRYSDPTGGGEDAFLVLPEWADPPAEVRVKTMTHETETFVVGDTVDPDEMIEEAGL